MREPSTKWSEEVAPDEEQRFEGYARQFADIQRVKSARWGKGRVLHRKQLLALRGKLEVFDGLPAHAAHGLFAKPATYDARLRLSNGGVDRAPDGRPDIRGLALKVLGVPEGPSALGGTTTEQDFLLINHSKFSFPKSDEFVGLAINAAKGPGALLSYLIGRYGFFPALKRVGEIAATFGKPFGGYAYETLHSAAPIACGPFAAKVRLSPVGKPDPAKITHNLAADVIARLLEGPLQWDLKLQFYVDDELTPIEDASVEWPDRLAPIVTVARLTVPRQGVQNELHAEVEAAKFDPWNALAAHRPLGDVMRARKVVYYESQKGRA